MTDAPSTLPSTGPSAPPTDRSPALPEPPRRGRGEGAVLACIDDSPYVGAICDFAAWSAERMTAPLTFLHVLDATSGNVPGSRNLTGAIGLGAREELLEELAELDEARARLAMERGRQLLAGAVERARDAAPDLEAATGAMEVRQRHGELVDAILALESGTRMLVVGKRGTASAQRHGHLGRHLEEVIRAVHKPILVAQQTFAPPARIMMAWDGSPTAEKGVGMIAAGALFRGIPCHLVHVGADRADVRAGLEAAAQTLRHAGFDAPTALLSGNPEDALPRYQADHDIDLLVMGAFGHSRIRRMILGSTTTAMLRTCTVSVMVLR
ncbi:MAG: universal stress protein [Gemmatimonadales bacterium]|nr:MAG: universal stress protein [Gemmatimonadales bacterium]